MSIHEAEIKYNVHCTYLVLDGRGAAGGGRDGSSLAGEIGIGAGGRHRDGEQTGRADEHAQPDDPDALVSVAAHAVVQHLQELVLVGRAGDQILHLIENDVNRVER